MCPLYIFIVNPSSGSGKSAAALPALQRVLEERGSIWRVMYTAAHGQGAEIASQAALERPEGIIAVGGDGTLSEVAGGLKSTGIPMLFAPCGTGNDFIKATSLSRDPVTALRQQLDAPIGHIDLGRMNERCFLNVAGTGLDVEVLLNAEKYKQNASGLIPYLHGVADAIREYAPVHARLSYDDEPLHDASFTILSIGNGQYIGGGMRAVPGASLRDGLLATVEARPLRKWQIGILMALFIPGLHARTGIVRCRHVKKLRILRPGMIVNLDGELIACDDAEFTILPGALTVRLPEC